MRQFVDIETDGLNPSRIWIIVCKDAETGEQNIFSEWHRPIAEFAEFAKGVSQWIGHNVLSFDIPVLNRLANANITNSWPTVVDTFVVSRLVNYKRFTTHSLDELGTYLKFHKGKFDDWSKLSQEMVDYCIQDVEVTDRVYHMYKRFINEETWFESMKCEHDMALICQDMKTNGFHFDKMLAESVLVRVTQRMDELQARMGVEMKPFLRYKTTLQYRTKNDGEPYQSVTNAYDRYDKVEMKGSDLHCYNYEEFNPASTRDRIEKLWEFGWNPVEKSDTHYEFSLKAKPGEKWRKTRLTKESYNEKLEYFKFYGWKVNETNLMTLPEDAPEAAFSLAEWLTLNGRLKALEERLREYEDDERIHTNFWHIGAWTHRMSHSAPNLANISSPFHGEPKNAVERVKAEYDDDMRRMFDVEDGWLVGTDAESIQLRILAHYLRNDDYVQAIVSGRKEDETDIHNLNRRALGLDHLTRDHAKTFIYAWLLGAGVNKVSRILSCNMATAKEAVDNFIESTDGLAALKSGQIKRDARRGYFVGLDGRKVLCDSDYLMLAGYLQNGESVVMKHANILWRHWADRAKLNYKQVNFIHDEWQTQVYGSRDAAEYLGHLQCKALEEVGKRLEAYCPMAGETRIGKNWLDTH